jgi:hypothetical protein
MLTAACQDLIEDALLYREPFLEVQDLDKVPAGGR